MEENLTLVDHHRRSICTVPITENQEIVATACYLEMWWQV